MKAILVFDVDNMNIDIENTQATYIELQCNDITIQMALLNHWLIPLPQKKEIDENYKMKRWDDDCDYAHKCGYNCCLEDILHGEEE